MNFLGRELEKLKENEDAKIILYANKWYRIAEAVATNHLPTASLVKIGTTYSTGTPFSAILSILTSYSKADISEMAKYFYGANKHIDKVRVQFDNETGIFYLDVHYNLVNKTNRLYANLIAKDEFWRLTNTTDVTEFETVAELDL